MSGESILRTLIELLEAQEQIKITYEIKEGNNENTERTTNYSGCTC